MWRNCREGNAESSEPSASATAGTFGRLGHRGDINPIKRVMSSAPRTGSSRLNRDLSAPWQPLAQRRKAGTAGPVSRSVLNGNRGTVQYEAGHGRPPLTASGADGRDPGVAVSDVAEAPSRQTGEWRDGALCLRARWQKPPSYRARKQTTSPGGTTPRTPDAARCATRAPLGCDSRANSARRRGS
jgi:hypothetical protein